MGQAKIFIFKQLRILNIFEVATQKKRNKPNMVTHMMLYVWVWQLKVNDSD